MQPMALSFRAPSAFLLLVIISAFPCHQTQDPRLIDAIVRDSTFQSYRTKHHKTAILYNVSMPPALSGVTAGAVRYRAGSLKRYGAAIEEFRVAPGVMVHPRTRRLIVVHQNLGNLSPIYSRYVGISGFQLWSPVLGLLFYRANRSELDIIVTRKPITVDFSNLVIGASRGVKPFCALLAADGNVTLSDLSGDWVCAAQGQGHFALVVKSSRAAGGEGAVSRWKVVVLWVAVGAFGSVLLGLMVVAVVGVRRKRERRAEMERRAYEEEALQISMVGHVRVPTAGAARTAPELEDGYAPSSRTNRARGSSVKD